MVGAAFRIFCILSFVFGIGNTYAEDTYPFFLYRENGSSLEGYFSPPATTSTPIVIAIQGSSCNSAFEWYTNLSRTLRFLGLGLIVIEKQGISRESIDLVEYHQTNSIEQRHEDYILCLKGLSKIRPHWKGKFIFWGESEGGIIATHLANQVPETAALLLFSAGGGISPREEVKWQIQHRLKRHGASQDEIDQYTDSLEQQMDLMLLDPNPNEFFLGNSYKWWASLLSSKPILSDITQLSIPICLVHGTQDEVIPVHSTDLIANTIKNSDAFAYFRIGGADHYLSLTNAIPSVCQWLAKILPQQDPWYNFSMCDGDDCCLYWDWETDISTYVFSRGGRCDVSGRIEASMDNEGNKNTSASVSVSTEDGSNGKIEGSAQVEASQGSDGKTQIETSVRVEGKLTF